MDRWDVYLERENEPLRHILLVGFDAHSTERTCQGEANRKNDRAQSVETVTNMGTHGEHSTAEVGGLRRGRGSRAHTHKGKPPCTCPDPATKPYLKLKRGHD